MQHLSPVVLFCLLLFSILGLTFFAHTAVLGQMGLPEFGDKIILSYLVNGILAGIIYLLLYYYRFKLKNYIGFLFMGGSFLKFIFFFVLFYPAYKADGDIGKTEFAAFFIPYAICLVIETVFTAKMLQKLD